ncbi:hypothetical protein LCL97_21635 [Seohaeicola saemankumensis]|nr:hypothetical protein [Seohaeicola saemankumensis]MCA0873441.1 hypothetical protein [Seohaeicola saemankumensis]
MPQLSQIPAVAMAASPMASNDYHQLPDHLPATAKQLRYARDIAARAAVELPAEALADRRALSAWIDAHRPRPVASRFANYPSSKQVGFAERIARIKRREVPPECFHDRLMMSRWIDSNK